MIIMKFGGTSTKDTASMLNVTKIVKSRLDKNPVIVISAIAQATNLLESMGYLAKDGKINEANLKLNDFIIRHEKIIEDGLHESEFISLCNEKINSANNELSDLISGVSILRELTPQVLDRFYSFGELLSSLIISFIMKENGIDTQWVDTKEFMITDDNFTRAKPIMRIVNENLTLVYKNLSSAKKTIVTQGFIGVTVSGERTTMGRESSDYSAALIGSVLNAEDIQIWTDVDGVLTGDPSIVNSPKRIKLLTFEEAYQLSMFGAKVLHPNTMIPANEKNIPIHVFNSKRPHVPGTLVTSNIDRAKMNPENSILKSITSKNNIFFMRVSPKKRFSPYIFWEHIYNILNKYTVTPLVTSTSEYMFSIAFEYKSNIDSIKDELSEIAKVEMEKDLSLISLVGTSLDKNNSIIKETISILSQYDVKYFSFGVSDICYNFLVDEKYSDDIVKVLHSNFFEKGNLDMNIFELLN